MVDDQTNGIGIQDKPFEDIPYVNYFQCLPQRPVAPAESTSFADKLLLDQTASLGQLFTIFISTPFCRSRCHSCHHFKELLPTHGSSSDHLDRYLALIEPQLHIYASTNRFSSARCGAVFLGGGTASLLSPNQVKRLICTIQESFPLDPDIEITLEGNPREFNRDYLNQIRDHGINRVSIGLQSFQDSILRKTINSPHDGAASHESAKNAVASGFNSVNIDLLYRLPGQTFGQWKDDLLTTLDYEPESITMYSYVVHKGSASEKLIARDYLQQPVDKEEEHEWYLRASELLEKYGYTEGIIGNFSRPGHKQKYGTLSYCEGAEIMGLGVGAYSFVNRYQFSAPPNYGLFKQCADSGMFPIMSSSSDRATDQNMRGRYIIFNFFASSLNRRKYAQRFGQDPIDDFPQSFSKLVSRGLLDIKDSEVVLTPLGKKWRSNVYYEFYANTFK